MAKHKDSTRVESKFLNLDGRGRASNHFRTAAGMDFHAFLETMNSDVKQHAFSRDRGYRLAIAEWFLLAALVILFVARALMPGWRVLNTDFPNYYLTAALRLQSTPVDRAYEWIWFQRQKDRREISQPLVGFVPNPPLCAAPLLPLAWLPALPAKRVWILLNLELLAAALWMMRRVTRLSWRRVLLIAALCVLPLRTNFNYGQYYIVILFLICLAYYAVVRGFRFTAGGVLAAAAWFKVFPAVFLLLFLRKRDWRAVAGLLVGLATLGTASVLIFGLDIHRVLFIEILPRALRGDLVGPYALEWSSFTSLWHRLFLFEPELNPAPLINSVWAYATAQALTGTALLFAFLLSTGDSSDTRSDQVTAWEWSAFVPLLLLLSSMPGPYHYCVLIFSTILGVDFLLQTGRWRIALLLAVFYAIACAPSGEGFALQRVLATFALYVVLLWHAPARPDFSTKKLLLAVAVVTFSVLVAFNLKPLRDRGQDFSGRLPFTGWSYASFNPVPTKQGIVSVEMVNGGYVAVNLSTKQTLPMPALGDVLALAASDESPYIYFELAGQRSQILRLVSHEIDRREKIPEFVAEGRQPAISYDGRWLAFLRQDQGRSAVWLSRDGAPPQAARGWQNLRDVLEMTVTTGGDIIAAEGGAANPHLIWLHTSSGEVQPLTEVAGAVRYPAISPDSALLAFSRRESGSWHLFVRQFATGSEQQLTRSACNATSPAWQDAHTLLYATDCGRGLGLGAVTRIDLTR